MKLQLHPIETTDLERRLAKLEEQLAETAEKLGSDDNRLRRIA